MLAAERGGQEGRRRWQPWCPRYLLVSLQLTGEGALVEEELQALLGVVVAELLEGGPPALPCQLRVLCPGGVYHRHRAHRVLARLQRPVGDKGTQRGERVLPAPLSRLSPRSPSTYLLRREMRRVKSSEYKPAAMPSRHSSAVSLGPAQGNPECPHPGVPRATRCPHRPSPYLCCLRPGGARRGPAGTRWIAAGCPWAGV